MFLSIRTQSCSVWFDIWHCNEAALTSLPQQWYWCACWFQGMETESGWIPLSKREASFSRRPSPLMQVMTGVEEEEEGEEMMWRAPNLASQVTIDFQDSAPPAPLTREEEQEGEEDQLVMKMMTKNCESAWWEVVIRKLAFFFFFY